MSTTTNPLLTNDRARRNLLPDDLRNMKPCSCAGFMKTVVGGEYFVTKNEAELAKLNCLGSCRNHTLFGDDDLSKAKGWIRGGLSSVGGNSQLPPSPLRNRDQNQLFVGRRISILGYDLHRSEQIRDGNVRRKTRKPRRRKWSKRGETCSVTNHQANTPTPKSKLKFNTMILSCPKSIMFLQTAKISRSGAMLHF